MYLIQDEAVDMEIQAVENLEDGGKEGTYFLGERNFYFSLSPLHKHLIAIELFVYVLRVCISI